MGQANTRQLGIDASADLLKVSAYDRAASMLIALLILVGSAVAILFGIWLTSRVFFVPDPPVVASLDEEEGTQNPSGLSRDIEEPGVEDLLDLAEPEVVETLVAVTDAVSSMAATLDALEGVVSSRGTGVGDNRKPGTGDGIIPRWQRWEIRYSSTTLEDYQKQLEFFGVELGSLGGGRPGVDYVAFKNGRPVKRTTESADDDRLYFIWQGGRFKEQDRSLMTAAGVPITGRVLCQFYSQEMENRLADLERQKLGNRSLRDVQKTYFGIQSVQRGFEFYVIDIRWRGT